MHGQQKRSAALNFITAVTCCFLKFLFFLDSILQNEIQIVMCTSVRPDFNAEEVASVEKNQKELDTIVEDMADHLPIEDPSKG